VFISAYPLANEKKVFVIRVYIEKCSVGNRFSTSLIARLTASFLRDFASVFTAIFSTIGLRHRRGEIGFSLSRVRL